MCIAVYIGATKELPLTKEVGARYTTFHVEVARDTEISKFRNILSSPYIYYMQALLKVVVVGSVMKIILSFYKI